MTIQEEMPQQNPFEDQRKQALELYENMAKECHHCSSFIQRAIESYNPDLQAQLSAKEQELQTEKEVNKNLHILMVDAEKRGQDKAQQELSSLRAEIKELKEASEVDVLSAKGHSKNLSDEIDRLRAKNDRLKTAYDYHHNLIQELTATKWKLESENDQLQSDLYHAQSNLEIAGAERDELKKQYQVHFLLESNADGPSLRAIAKIKEVQSHTANLEAELNSLRKRCEDLEAALRESMNYWFFGYKSDYPEEREAFTEKCRNLLNQIKS